MSGGPARVRCERCGPKVVRLADVRVVALARGATYAFTCPDCGERTRRPADAQLLAVLREAGAVSFTVHSDTARGETGRKDDERTEDGPA